MQEQVRKLLEQLDTNDLELLLKELKRKQYTCPLCGAKLDRPVERPGCYGDPSWHEEGFAEVRVTVEFN